MNDSADFTQAAAALARVLQAENEALRAVDFAAAASLLPAKREASRNLESCKPGGSGEGLREIIKGLDALAAENRALLSRSIGVQSEVLGIIAAALRSSIPGFYGSSGKSAARGGAFAFSAKA